MARRESMAEIYDETGRGDGAVLRPCSCVGGVVDWGLEPRLRHDLIDGDVDDGIVGFGRHRGKWLGQMTRHWLSWLLATRESEWPQNLLDLVYYWGEQKSFGKDQTFEQLVSEQRVRLRERVSDE